MVDRMLTETCLTYYTQTALEREKNPSCINQTLDTPQSTVEYITVECFGVELTPTKPFKLKTNYGTFKIKSVDI